MGCDGSGRGPPTGICGGRGPAGRGGRPTPGRAATPVLAPPGDCGCPDAAPVAGRAEDGTAGRAPFGASLGDGRGAADVGSGAIGVVGRCSSMRRRNVGGTTRPGAGVVFAGGSTSRAGGASGCSGCDSGIASTGASTTSTSAASATAGAASIKTGSAASIRGGGSSTGSVASATTSITGAAGFAVFTRRGGGSAGPAGLTGSGGLFPRASPLFPLPACGFPKNFPPWGQEFRSP